MKSARTFLRQARIPSSVTLELTLRCNLRCGHCYQRFLPKLDELNVTQWLAIIDRLRCAGTFQITLTGGEPLLYPHFTQLIQSGGLDSFKVSIITNGTLWTPELVGIVSRLPHKEVQVSLYGSNSRINQKCTGTKNTLPKAVGAIRMLRDAGISVRAFSLLLDVNADDHKQLEMLCDRIGVPLGRSTLLFPAFNSRRKRRYLRDARRLSYIQAHGGREYLLSTATSEPAHFSCSAGYTAFAISPTGECMVCEMLRQPFALANNEQFLELWFTHPRLVQIRSISGNDDRAPLCGDCDLRNRCKRCPAYFVAMTGSEMTPPGSYCSSVRVALAACSASGDA